MSTLAALHADVLVFATPIYYYEMSGQLKTLLDRLNPLFPSDYAFRDVYLLTAAAEDEAYVPRRAVSGLEGRIECFERARLAGTVFMGGVTAAGENPEHPAGEASRPHRFMQLLNRLRSLSAARSPSSIT